MSCFPNIGTFPDIWDDISPAAPPPPAGRTGHFRRLRKLMSHCHDSGRIYMKCKTLALSLVGLIHGIVWKSAASHPGPSESAGLSGPLTWIHLTSSKPENNCWKGA